MRETRCFKDGNIEVSARRRGGLAVAPLELMYMARFVLDLIMFRVLKNRYGHLDMTPEEAHTELAKCIDRGDRVLLLVD